MKLSVIVPVYNVEKFLPRCLDSLLRQGMEVGEWEVICVNDGSPDNSAVILAEYEQKHPDIFKVITQENQGLGGARNTGTDLAKGEYVTYLDSDDYLIDGAYRYLIDHFCGGNAEGVKPDVLVFNETNMRTDGKTLLDPNAKPDGVVTFEGDGAEAYSRLPLAYVWTKFYRRDFLLQYSIRSEIVICQDSLFNFEVFKQHPYILIVSSNVCRYERNNENSVQTTKNKKKVLKQLDELFFDIDYMTRNLQLNDEYLQRAARRCINRYLYIYFKKTLSVHLSYSEWLQKSQRLKSFPIYKMYDMGGSPSSRFIVWLKNLSNCNYFAYILVSFLYRKVFMRYIHPQLMP